MGLMQKRVCTFALAQPHSLAVTLIYLAILLFSGHSFPLVNFNGPLPHFPKMKGKLKIYWPCTRATRREIPKVKGG
jgi:hypothetical protein